MTGVVTNARQSSTYRDPAMSSHNLLSYASRVEAAVASYLEVRDFTDENKWREKFDRERVSFIN